MNTVYNKLVRDKIPEIITESGKTPETEIVPEEQMAGLLVAKLVEEVQELDEAHQSGNFENIINEMADVEEVLFSLRKRLGLTLGDIHAARNGKASSRGSFDKGIRLLSVEDNKED